PVDGDADLHEALAALRPEDAELLRLWAWEQLTPAEIAVVLDVSANAAGVRLHRARARLREQLGKNGAGAGHEESREGSGP
ncbi:MAG: sigma factor-like helix-turn-helix DNA-binding protein, partial [Nocardioides sp.]